HVQQAELDRVDPEGMGNLVELRFRGEAGLRPARGAIGASRWLVGDDVVAVVLDVRDVVDAPHPGRRPGAVALDADVPQRRRLARQDLAVLADAGLDGHPQARRRPAVEELLLARVDDLHRTAGRLGEQHRVAVDHAAKFGAEAAANSHADDVDLVRRDVQRPGDVAAYGEDALRARPAGDLAGRVHVGNRDLRLDVGLVGARDDVAVLEY